MGARKSIHAGQAKIDVNVDLTHKLCSALLLPEFRNSRNPFSQIIGSLSIEHPSLFGGREKLDLVWDKGLSNSNVRITFRRPRPEWLTQHSLVIHVHFHSITPEIVAHESPINNFLHSGSGGINLSRFSVCVDLDEPAIPSWSSKTSIKFEQVRPIDDVGRSINRDHDGFPITCSGGNYDNMVVLKQEAQRSIADDQKFSRLTFQMEQGLPLLSKWLIFNRFKFIASKGLKVGPAFLLTSLTGGSIVGDMAPYQAFSIGGPGSVRGYSEGAVSSGRSCLIANTELMFPVTKKVEGAIFMDYGTDLGSAPLVPGYPAVRQGKPGFGAGFGCGLCFNSKLGQIRIDCAINNLQQKTIHFGINNVGP